MFIHSVYFWLKPDLTDEQKAMFLAGVKSLVGIETVRQGWVGTPAATDREIIDRSYSYALVLAFDGQEGHDLYQAHPVHDRFREQCAALWSKVLIYDAVSLA